MTAGGTAPSRRGWRCRSGEWRVCSRGRRPQSLRVRRLLRCCGPWRRMRDRERDRPGRFGYGGRARFSLASASAACGALTRSRLATRRSSSSTRRASAALTSAAVTAAAGSRVVRVDAAPPSAGGIGVCDRRRCDAPDGQPRIAHGATRRISRRRKIRRGRRARHPSRATRGCRGLRPRTIRSMPPSRPFDAHRPICAHRATQARWPAVRRA